MESSPEPRRAYESRLERYATAHDNEARRSRFVAYARLATSLGALACLVAGLAGYGGSTRVLLWAAGALGAAFAGLVVYHGRVEERLSAYEALHEINRQGLKRLAREWRELEESEKPAGIERHPYANDLDLFGRASLFQLTWIGGTGTGLRILARWLSAPATLDDIVERQAAVAELAPLVDLRQSLAASARAGRIEGHDVEGFLEWAETPPWFSRHAWAVWAARGLTAVTVLLVLMHAGGLLDQPFWLAAAVANLIFTAPIARKINQTFDHAFARQAVFVRYADIARRVGAPAFSSSLLSRLQSSLASPDTGAPRAFRRLHLLMSLADLRHSALLHLPVHALTLWDVHVLVALERWQNRSGPHAREWVEALGTVEAAGALAGLLHDHPGWTLPRITDDGEPVFAASGLGHPLIRPDRRVDNDVRVGPPGTFLLVTGSNMSGKSTLLRAIGLNTVLALAGGPVCARELTLPPVRLATSMRVDDSLEEGLSYFMAALTRLKHIVDAARRAPGAEPPTLMYLLDEVLGGTNTTERQIAVRRILKHLLGCNAIGAITTHDLSLADTPSLERRAVAVHFSETVEAGAGSGILSFDYRLRDGVATSRNALKLMELVGLGDE